MKVYNDLLSAADNGQLSALCLLDLTAAFDTVDHELLLSRLERQFGLRDSILQWFRSYLGDRSFRVVYGASTSTVVFIVCSVPQGSVLGPLLFVLYAADLVNVVESTASDSTPMRTTRSSACISVEMNLQRPSNDLNGA